MYFPFGENCWDKYTIIFPSKILDTVPSFNSFSLRERIWEGKLKMSSRDGHIM